MPKFRRKPVIVEAVQFDPDEKPWPPGVGRISGHWTVEGDEPPRYAFLSGDVGSGGGGIRSGDWIVTNPTGERYIVRQDFFFDVYEIV